MFTKDEIKTRVRLLHDQAIAAGRDPLEAQYHLALIIMSCALYDKKGRAGEDYGLHPMHVSQGTQSYAKRIIALLHDVVEDSDWTLDDLREVGFSERVVNGVDGLTLREHEGEKYFEFIVRAGASGEDVIDIKMSDIHHNSDSTRFAHIQSLHRQEMKSKAYNIAYYYLLAIKRQEIEPGTPLLDFIQSVPSYMSQPRLVNHLLDLFSNETRRVAMPPEPQPGMAS